MAKSTDELMSSRSITGRTDFLDYDMLDAMSASALQKLVNRHVHFRQRFSVEEQIAERDDRLCRGRQIAYMIYERFCSTGAYEAVQRLSDLFKKRLKKDNVQEFDVRRHQALLTISQCNTDGNGPGRIVQVKIAGLCSASDFSGFA